MMNIPYSKISLAGKEYKYIKEVLKSGWLTTSSKTLKFEEVFSNYIGVKYACAVNSCTSALHLAVEACGIQPGDKVLVPSLTFTASAEVIRYMGAHPVFIDVDYSTGNVSPAILSEQVRKHSDIKAIILVHYGGQAAQMTSLDGKGIVDICNKYNIQIIEDAAHAFPTKFEHQYVGSFGRVGCFSFYANKTITTGEGGMLVTNDKEIYDRVKTMRLHGISKDIWQRFTEVSPSWEYDVVAPGYKYNMPDINAAIGLAQVEKAEFFRQRRQRCATFYYKVLAEIADIDLPLNEGLPSHHSWHLFPIVIKPESNISRNDFIQKMAKYGIGTSVHYKPLHHMSYYRDTYNLDPREFPNTERIWKGVVSLPIYPDLSDIELDYICKKIHEIFS